MSMQVDLFWSFRSPYSYLVRRPITGGPLMVFEGELFFGQDRLDLLCWRLQQRGLQKR